jgi:pimeloyl-ACP methyl ester carboxylesterase
MSEIRHHDAQIEGPIGPSGKIRLHVAEAGPKDGRLIVLLHGFPDFWGGWRGQVDPLVRAGFRVLMPDMRGYGTSEKPKGIASYSEKMLASDVVGLIHWAGHSKAIVVGHDWGGAAAWRTAIRYPDAVERLIILNCPHPAAMRKKFASDPRQLAKSWYMFFFQLPRLPEAFLKARRFGRLIGTLKKSARKGTFSEKNLDEFREAWGRPDAMTAMVNYYRAAMRPGAHSPSASSGAAQAGSTPAKVQPPTTILWGMRDPHLSPSLAEESAEFCENGRVERLPEATHWLQYEEPAKVASLIIAACGSGSASGGGALSDGGSAGQARP